MSSKPTRQAAPPPSRYPLAVKNTSGEVAPPYAIMRVVGAPSINAIETYSITKPLGATAGQYLINSPAAIPINGFGVATNQSPVLAAYNPFDGVPVSGTEWGPNPLVGGWFLSISGKGFGIIGGADASSGTVRVASTADANSNSQNGDVPIIFIRNDSGIVRQNREIVGIGAPLIAPTGTFPLPGTLPVQPTFASASPSPNRPCVILLGSVGPGEVIDAITVGIQATRINFTDTWHTRAKPINDNYANMESGLIGPHRIVARELETVIGNGTYGVQWAFLELNSPDIGDDDIRAYAYTTITAATGNRGGNLTPGTGLAKLYNKPTGAAGSPWFPDLGSPVSVENWMHGAIESDKPLLLKPSRWLPDGRMLYVVAAEGCKAIAGSS